MFHSFITVLYCLYDFHIFNRILTVYMYNTGYKLWNKTGTFKVGVISKAQKVQFLKYGLGGFHEKLPFSNLRLLFSKTQYSSDIALYSGHYVKISDNIEKIICGCILT